MKLNLIPIRENRSRRRRTKGTNNDEPKDFEQTEVSSETPSYLSKYVAPSELGNDPCSGNFKLDGVVYNLPVPLQVLEDKF